MIEVTRIGNWALIALAGDFDVSNADGIRAVAVDLAADPVAEVVVDLGQVSFIGAAGISALVSADSVISAASGRVVLVGASPLTRRVFALAGVTGILPLAGLPAPFPVARVAPTLTVGDDELIRLLAEVSRLLLTESTVTGDLRAVARAAVDVVPGCTAASIALVARSRPHTAAVSDETAVEVDLAQYATGEGPCLLAAVSTTRIHVETLSGDERFARFAGLAGRLGIGAVLSVPVALGDVTIGTVNLYSPEQFAPGADAVAEVIAAQVTAALTKSEIYGAALALAERVQERSEADREVNIAAGVLAGFEQCSLDQAERLLRLSALAEGDSLEEAARRVLGHLATRDSGPP